MAELPTADELFGKAGKEQLPSADELFGKPYNAFAGGMGYGESTVPMSSAELDQYWNQSYTGHLMKTFGAEFGPETPGLSEDSIKWLRDNGVFNDYKKGQANIGKALNEAIARPAAAAFDIFLRGSTAGFRTGQEAVTELGRIAGESPTWHKLGVGQLARDIAAIPESTFGSPHPTGTPHPVPDLAAARDLKVIGGTESDYMGTSAPATGTMVAPMRAQVEAAPPPAPPSAPTPTELPVATDIHALARQAAPEVFAQYDALVQQQQTLRSWVNDFESERDQRIAAEAPNGPEITALEDKIASPEVTVRLAKKYQARLDALQAERDKYIEDHTPADEGAGLALARQRLQETNQELQKLAPKVGDAYQQASAQIPAEAPDVGVVAPTQATPESLKSLIDTGAPSAQIEAHPLVQKAQADAVAMPRTYQQPGYGTPEWQANRVFDFNGEKVVGYANAIPRLIQRAESFAGGEVKHDRTVTIVIGPPAAGKSAVAERQLASSTGSAVVDVDEAKKVMPEFGGGIGASAVHEESTHITQPVMRALLDRGANIVYPRVGANADKLGAEIALFRNFGYKVNLVNVSVKPEEAYRRMIRRFLKTGRLIERNYFFNDVDGNPDRVYTKLRDKVDQAVQIDANGPPGSEKVIDGQNTELARALAGKGHGGSHAPSVHADAARASTQNLARPDEGPQGLIGIQPTGQHPHRVTAADGTAIEVVPVVVEAKDLKTSADKGYDKGLQPRQRERAASQAQIREIAHNLDPERLGYSSEADRGAPIVGSDANVESGNGRVLALREVYHQGGEAAQRYREWLANQGVDVARYKEPVLVRQRITPLDAEQRKAFTIAANQATTLTMSAPERAAADATHITGDMLGLIRNPDDLGAIANRDFIRSFLKKLPKTEQGALVNAEGGLSAEGLTRVRNAILARAYGDSGILSRIAESTNDEVKSISSALVSVAPDWAQLRADIDAGRVRADVDLTAELLEAVKRTADIRAKGVRLESYLAQQDAFERLRPEVENFMRMFYDANGRRAASAQRIAESLKLYATEAGKVSADAGLDLGLKPVTPADLQKLVAEKQGTPFVEGNLFEAPPVKPAVAVTPAQETSPTIARDVASKLVAAGRPQKEADAVGALIAAHYEARADRFNGAKGTASDLYKAEFNLTRGDKGGRKGEAGGKTVIKNARATITLFQKADSSTAIHELGHTWLEELMRDAADPQAPAELIADRDAVLKWLGVDRPEDIKTKAHEQFARGFEAYVMEGRAPSYALADVFTQFRDWLMKVYQSVKALKVKLTPEMRSVFDRQLANAPDRPVIASDRPAPQSLADLHEADVNATPPERAREAAANMQRERDRAAAELRPEIQNARFEGVDSGARGRPPGSPQPDSAGNVTASFGEGGFKRQDLGTVGAGGGETAVKSARARQGAVAETTKAPESPFALLPTVEPKFVDKAGNIRLDNLNTPEDVNTVLRQASAENGDFMSARRGVMSDAETMDLADALGMDAATLDRRKIGEAFNAEQIIAARKLLIQSATHVRDLMAAAAQGGEAELLAYAEAKQRHLMIQEQVAGITAEAGRALRAFRSMEGMKEAQAISQFLQDNTTKTLFQLRREAQLGMKLDTPQKVSKFVHDVEQPKWSDKLIEVWINALLSGPKTHLVNMISNALVALYTVPEAALAGAVGSIFKTFGKEKGVYAGEAGARLWGIARGSKEGVIAAAELLKDEELGNIHNNKVDQRKHQAIGGIAGKIVRIPGRLLTAEDQVFKGIAYRQEIQAQAFRMAKEQGLEGQAFAAEIERLTNDPTPDMIKAAEQNAVYQTFNQKLGRFGSSVQNFANSHPFVKLVIPFVRTPVNIVKFAQERSVLGLASREVQANLSGVNGAAARDTQIARMALGTAVSVAAITMAVERMMTGGGPSDPKERAVKYLSGWQPYSIKIGDQYYSYARLEPLGTLLGVAADMAEVWHASTDGENENIAKLILASIAKNLTSKTWVQGPAKLIQAVTDPDRYGRTYIQQLAGTVVPTGVAQVAQADDPYLREARTILDSIKARIPGLRGQLFARRDIWGEPINQDAEGIITNDPVNQALLRLRINPGKVSRTIRGVELSDQQYDDFARIAGRSAKMRLNQIVNQPGFAAAPEFVQRELIINTINAARETARSIIMMQHPEIISSALKAKQDYITTGQKTKPMQIQKLGAGMDSLEGVVNLTTQIAPKGIDYEHFRRSTNVEDMRQESQAQVNGFLSGDRQKFDNFVNEFGPGIAYNMAVRGIFGKDESIHSPDQKTLDWINAELVPALKNHVYTPEEWKLFKSRNQGTPVGITQGPTLAPQGRVLH